MNRYLRHHGIKGQKWGVKNGPPYPLDAKTHNRVVKKKKAKTSGLGTVLAYSTVALYAVAKYSGLIEKAKVKIADKLDPPVSRSNNNYSKITKKGKSFNEIDDKLIQTINGKQHYNLTDGGKVNCVSCSVAYVSDTVAYEKDGKTYAVKPGLFAENVKVSDETTGIKNALNNVDVLFDIDRDKGLSFEEFPGKIKKNSTGIFFINGDDIFTYGGHAINYECDSNGDISVVDCQSGKKYKYSDYVKFARKYDMNKVCAVYDCTNASLNKDYEMLDKFMK